MGPDGVKRREYEVQWENYPNSQNTWKFPRELPANSTMKNWMRLAKDGHSAGREASKNREQVNSVYAVLGRTSTMKLPLSHNRSFTREDLLWESVYDSLHRPTDTFPPSTKSLSPSNGFSPSDSKSLPPRNDSRAPTEAVCVAQIEKPPGILVHHGTRTDNKRLSVSWRPDSQLAVEGGLKKNVSTAISPPVSSPVHPSEKDGPSGKSAPTPEKHGEHLFPPPGND